MKNIMIRTAQVLALTILGVASAQAQQQKVEIGGAGSSGIQPAKVTVGSKANAAVVLSVTGSEGKAVTGEASNLTAVTFVVPGGAPCGMSPTSVTEVKPGIYRMTLAMPALPQCVWAEGDYLAVARIGTVNYAGMAPFVVSVR